MDIKKKKSRLIYFGVRILLAALIVLSCAVSIITDKSESNNVANAAVSGSSDIGTLTISGYENNPNGKVFDGDKLRALYSQIVGEDNATYGDVVNLLANSSKGELNSKNFRTNNGGNEIYVTLDGMKWVATYLANNKSSQPVLTLWLLSSSDIKDSNYSSYYFNNYTSPKTLGTYPANMYGTSEMRAVGLNNGGVYGTSITEYDTATKSAKHPFARFTMENGSYNDGQVTGSLYNFIEIPKQMEWQEFEQSKAAGDPDGSNYENDAWNSVGGFAGLKRTSLEAIPGYANWNEDKIWLPGLAEIGYDTYRAMWQVTNATFKSSEDYWSRTASAASRDYCDTCFIQTGIDTKVNLSQNIRPAFHLNLYKVEQSATVAKPVQGSKVKDYANNNANINFELLGADISKLDIECSGIDVNGDALPQNTMTYNSVDGGGTLRLTSSVVGVYTVQVAPKSGLTWTDKTTTPIQFTYYLKYKVPELDIAGNKTAVYNGQEQSFALLNYDKDKMDVKASAVTDLTFDDSVTPAVFKVINVKQYSVNVELKNKTLMEWSSGGTGIKSVSFEITKKKVTKPTLSDNPPSKDFTGSPLTFPLLNYTAGGDVELKGPSPSTAVVPSITQTNVGTYYYTISLKDKNNTEWRAEDGGGTADDTLTVYITLSGIAKPSLSSSAELLTLEKTYSTTTTPKGATFTIYNTTGATITPADNTQTDATISGNTITVTKVGTYTFTVSLADSTNTQWNDGTKGNYDLIVKVKAKEVVKPTLSDNPASKPYTGNPITFGVTGMNADIELKDPSSATVATITQTNADTYDYTATLVDPINTVWVGGGTAVVHLPITITRKNIEIPHFAPGADKKTYDGSKQTFSNPQDFEDNYIEIKDMEGNVVTAFAETNAGTYTYKMNLKDKDNTQWAGTDEDIDEKEIKFYIDKKTLNITSFTSSESGNPPAWEVGAGNVTFTVVEDSLTGDTVKLKLYVEQSGKKVRDLTNDESVAKNVTVTIPSDLPQGSYFVVVDLDNPANNNANGNYTLSTTNTSQYRKTFVVKGQGLGLTEENMPWIYTFTDKDFVEHKEDILAQEGETKRSVKLTYTGYEYQFTVDTEALFALGAVIDTDKEGTNGTGFTGDTKCTNATTSEKIITVYWKTAEGYESASGSFELKYYIEKAKYDLTNTKWNYTSPFDYDPLLFRSVSIIDLPTGLTINSADYVPNSNRQKNAGNYTAELLSMQNSNINYYDPLPNNKDTYIYNKDNNEFPWKFAWEIMPQKLNLTWTTKASDNNDFTYWVVAGEEEEQIEGYLFYKNSDYNNTTGEATGDPIELSDIVVPKKQIDVYWVVAVLVDANNYEIVSGKAQRFTVGSLKEMVKVELKDTQPFIYNGNQYGKDIKVTSDEGTLTSANIVKRYYKDSVSDDNLLGSDAPIDAGEYILVVELQAGLEDDYELTVTEIRFEIEQAEVEIALSKSEYKYDGKGKSGEFVVASNNYDLSKIKKTYYKETKDFPLAYEELPCDAGKYIVVFSLADEDSNNYKIKSDSEELEFTIAKAQIEAKWVNGENNIPMISGLDETLKGVVGYVYYDEEGNPLEEGATLEAGKSYKVKAIFLGDNAKNYEFVTEDGQATPNDSAETEKEDFTVSANNNGGNLGGVNGGDEENPPATSFDFSKILDAIKNNWQPILSIVSILFTLIFMSKGMGYAGKRKKVKKTIEKRYTSYYAISGVGLFGLPNTTWTMIACILAGVAVLAFIFMLLQKRALGKALEDMEDAKEEYTRNREEANYMRMTGGMNGGMGMAGQAGVVYQQPQFAIEDMRGMINEAMSNMLPSVTQYLPQQASVNDELVQQLIDQNAQNEERIRQLTQENEERIRELTDQNQEIIRNLAQGQEMLMQRLSEQPKDTVGEDVIERLIEKLAKQQVEEKDAEKEVASAVVNEKTLEELKETIRQEVQSLITTTKTVEKDGKDEKIEMLMRNQEMLMRQMMEMASRNNDKQVVVPYMSQPSERLMEKMIDLATKSAEKSVEKYVPIPVEKVVEKEVKVEVPVEKIVEKEVVKEVPVPVEVEKIVEVEKVVPMPVEKPAKAAKTPAARLTLDEAYAKLSDKQKKIFDTLKAYALSKDKCKEKKSTYFTVLGQSTVNPLVKLTIKKNTTVAMFKMEDEYFKDIRKNAGSDGTKMKVKETELVVSDNQALATAKDMIDLREDQIERYNEFLKEQKSLRNK